MLALLVGAVSAPVATAAVPATTAVAVTLPRATSPERPFVVKLRLPSGASAVDGRVLVDPRVAELWGVAPVGGGTALHPEAIAGGYAFGAYDLHAVGGKTVVRLVLSAHTAGRLGLRVMIDAVASTAGRRVGGAQLKAGSIGVRGASRSFAAPAPAAGWRVTPTRAAAGLRELAPDGRIDGQDLDAARLDWMLSRIKGSACGSALAGDANGDGCVDVVDLQATLAARGRVMTGASGTGANVVKLPALAPDGQLHLHRHRPADTVDALPGNGICADANGVCTLRAAMNESNWDNGNDTINFNLPGTAPVTIQIATQLPNISSRTGTVTIDGYSQPGSQRQHRAVRHATRSRAWRSVARASPSCSWRST